MKIGFLLTIISLVTGFQSMAQLKGFSVGPYAEMIWPMGRLDETNDKGIGGGINADIRIRKFGLTASAGFIHFSGKSMKVNDDMTKMPAINAFPIRAGIKYRFIPAVYFKLEGGVARFINNSGSAVIFSPGIGLRVLGLDLQAKYETWINEGSGWGVKLGYNF